MTPTLKPGDIVFVQPTWHPHPARGTVVLLHRRQPPLGRFIKRVIGLPGETLQFRNASVVVNGQPLAEPYVPEAAGLEPKADQTITLGPEEFALLGDARDDSLDSRRFGAVRSDEIEGIARWRIWPPARMGGIR